MGEVVQLELPVWDGEMLRRRLEALVGAPIELALTDNASTMMSYRPARRRSPARIRLHRMFLRADQAIVDALAAWMTGRRSNVAGPAIDRFIAAHRHLIARRKPSPVQLVTRGLYHDLHGYYLGVKQSEFGGSIDVPVTWGRLPAMRRRRSIRLGSYSADDHLIRIHPHLDQPFVPDFFVRYIVFHEMLHAYLGIEVGPNGRRRIHTREFNTRERAYPDYARAVAWHDNPTNLARLLRPAKKSA